MKQADRDMIDAIRAMLGFGPLYGREPKSDAWWSGWPDREYRLDLSELHKDQRSNKG